jgi:hypothetical protein
MESWLAVDFDLWRSDCLWESPGRCEYRVVTRALELAAVAALRAALPDAEVHDNTPAWLLRPGRPECGDRWKLVTSIYRELTDLELPDQMPPRERRHVDAVIEQPGKPARIFEFDESQHFNAHRATTLRAYADGVETAFPRDIWLRASESSTKKLGTTGGWGKAKPPLFPDPGGRHLQACVPRRARRSLAGDPRMGADASHRGL